MSVPNIPPVPASLRVAISPEVLSKFPGTKVGFLLARVVVMSKPPKEQETFLRTLKQGLVPLLAGRGITFANYADTAVCASWKRTFATFGTPDDKQSTITNLLRRVVTEGDKIAAAKAAGKTINADLGKISNFVDLYNAVSVTAMTPMGALNLRAIQGDIELRYGKQGETFTPLGRGEEIVHEVTPEHVVYADSKAVLTWLWNFRDAKHCAVPRDSAVVDGKPVPDYILLFADQSEQGTGALVQDRPGDVEEAIAKAAELLPSLGADVLFTECLSAKRPEATYDLTRIEENEVTVTPQVTIADCEAAAAKMALEARAATAETTA